ncbi:MAG TPA: spore coat U domain-containing protein [Thermoanaerobaculia bacterium]|nr:spore coat U domain-containing protein [Thermoanaerobaculia bacterium]
MRNIATLALMLFCVPAARANCTWNQAPSTVDFGTYSAFTGGNLAATSPFQVKCSPNSRGQVVISAGTPPASFTPRTLKGPGGRSLPYNLYLDATYTAIWGDGTGGSVAPAAYSTGRGGGNTYFDGTIYAFLPDGGDVPSGTYIDAVSVDIVDGQSRDATTLTITLIVARACTVSAFSIAFGNYDTVGANEATPLDATAPIDVRCTAGTTATVILDAGMHASGGERRLMSAGGDYLRYNVFMDATRASVWNDVTVKTGTAVSMNTPVVLNPGGSVLFGRVFAGQDVPAGTYTDTLQATVNY